MIYGNNIAWKSLGGAPAITYPTVDVGKYQTIATRSNLLISSNFGASFSSVAYDGDWFDAAISMTGQYQLAARAGGENTGVYYSSNYGSTWTCGVTGTCRGVAMTEDATQMYCAIQSGLVYKSTNYGSSWTSVGLASGALWYGVQCSPDGVYVIVFDASPSGYWLSSNSGATWTDYRSASDGAEKPFITKDGQTITGNLTNGVTYDFGSSWTSITPPATGYTVNAMDWTGQYMYAVIGGGNSSTIYRSSDYGASWTNCNVTYRHRNISCSSDGSIVIVPTWGDGVYRSTNYGVSFSSVGLANAERVKIGMSTGTYA